MTAPAPATDAIAYQVDTAAELLGSTRTKLYEAIARGDLEARKDGRRTVILRTELVRYAEALPVRPVGD